MFDELYFNISVVSEDLEMYCDWSTSFAFRFSRRSCGRNAWWTPKNVCAGCYRLMRNVVCGAFRIRLYYLKRKGVKWAQRGPQVCQSNVDQSPTWNKDLCLLPLPITYQPFVSNRVVVVVFFLANLNLNTFPVVTAITVVKNLNNL